LNGTRAPHRGYVDGVGAKAARVGCNIASVPREIDKTASCRQTGKMPRLSRTESIGGGFNTRSRKGRRNKPFGIESISLLVIVLLAFLPIARKFFYSTGLFACQAHFAICFGNRQTHGLG
jgi:hypothetical protein